MNITHLRYALEVSRSGSITQAAENLYVGQPNLSKAIRELEGTLGFEIFSRTTRGVTPTARGAEFLARALKAVEEMDSLEQSFCAGEKEQSTLCVSFPQSKLYIRALASFLKLPMCSEYRAVRVQNYARADLLSAVQTGECAFGVLRCGEAKENYFLDMLSRKGLIGQMLRELDLCAVVSQKTAEGERNVLSKARMENMHRVTDTSQYIDIAADLSGGVEKKEIQCCGIAQTLELLREIPDSYAILPTGEAGEGFCELQADIKEPRLRERLVTLSAKTNAREIRAFVCAVNDEISKNMSS